VSPRALIDVIFVAGQAIALMRRIAKSTAGGRAFSAFSSWRAPSGLILR